MHIVHTYAKCLPIPGVRNSEEGPRHDSKTQWYSLQKHPVQWSKMVARLFKVSRLKDHHFHVSFGSQTSSKD